MFDFSFSKTLKKITPNSDELLHISKSTEIVTSYLNSASSKFAVDVVAGGSTAKGTFLKGNFDIDIFVRFKTDEKNLSDILELMLEDFIQKNDLVLERVHGSRDYFNFEFNDLFFEIVPVKYVEDISLADNVTDMSPLHVFWVKEHLTDDLRNDIRLAKQFCKSIGVYGAESFINGFSGHVLDILVIYYGGFIPFLESVSSWKSTMVIDPENKHSDVFKELNKSKLVSPLIVIDPIDPQRNAAAAVSVEKYSRFIKFAKEFLSNPSDNYFIIPKFNLDSLIQRKSDEENLFVIDVVPNEGKKDIVITKVLKIFEHVSRHLELNGFTVKFSDWFIGDNSCKLYFFIDKKELSKTYERRGPPIKNIEAVESFSKVHNSPFEKDGYLWVVLDREFTDADICLKDIISSDFVKERSLSVSLKKY